MVSGKLRAAYDVAIPIAGGGTTVNAVAPRCGSMQAGIDRLSTRARTAVGA